MSVSGLAVVAVAVTACGGGSSNPTSPSGGGNGPAFVRGNFTSAAGKVVSVSGSTAGLKSTTGTTDVAFASTTSFSKISTVSLSSLATGDCVTVADVGNSGGAATATSITARSVSITATSGCSQRFGGAGGPGAGGGTPPGSGGESPFGNGQNPSPRPTGSPGAGPGFRGGPRSPFGGAFGTIASISGSSFVVTQLIGDRKITVKTTSSTTFSATSVVTSAALVTGTCASAVGSKTTSGTVDARSITISAPVNGTCSQISRFAGPGGFGGGPGNGPGGGGFGSASPGAANA